MTNPYADSWHHYRDNGWNNTLPLPHQKKTWPPIGYTGYDAKTPSYADCYTWADTTTPHNIALRLPTTVAGIDVDAYNDKPGGHTLHQLADKYGPLPATWLTSSRGDGISGIRLYQIPPGTRLITALPGIEIIQHFHRYVVAPPSIHPNGGTYTWINEHTGETSHTPPNINDLPHLPDTWLAGLTDQRNHTPKDRDADTAHVLLNLPDGDPCEHVLRAAGHAHTGHARHDSYTKAQLAVVAAGRRGCPGAKTVLQRLRAAFLAEVTGDGRTSGEAAAEWKRGLHGAAQMVAGEPQGAACGDDLSWIPQDTVSDGPTDTDANPKGFIDWPEFWARERTELEYVIPDLIPTGTATALYSAPGVGKSLLSLELSIAVATGGRFLNQQIQQRRVLYIDQEQDHNLLRERLDALGVEPTIDLSALHYSLLGDWPGLDSDTGGRQVIAAAEQLSVSLVVLDTVSKLVDGEENSNDTFLQLTRHTMIGLRRLGIAVLRIDHSGKDEQRGQRGGSAKAGDVDLIYRLRALNEDGSRLELKREKNRPHLEYDDKILLRRDPDEWPLQHVRETTDAVRRDQVSDAVALLDRLGVPVDAGRGRARRAVKKAGESVSNAVLEAAIKARKSAVDGSAPVLPTPKGGGQNGQVAAGTCPDLPGEQNGQVLRGNRVPARDLPATPDGQVVYKNLPGVNPEGRYDQLSTGSERTKTSSDGHVIHLGDHPPTGRPCPECDQPLPPGKTRHTSCYRNTQ